MAGRLAEHENSIGESDEWYTPQFIFDALQLQFDLDPCSPGSDHWVPAQRVYTKADNGLLHEWSGRVFMNPPFGGRNGHVPWLMRFLDHGDGVAIVRAYTSSKWWHDLAPRAHGILFPRGKTKFIRPDGTQGKAPGHGVALISMDETCCRALRKSGLGMYWDLTAQPAACAA